MNERLKELAEQAGLVRNGDFGMKRWEGLHSDSISDQDLDKFAELIVKECLNQCRQEWYDTNNDPVINANKDPRMIGIKIGIKQGAIRCLDRIKTRFGAEV